jgi:glycosyltransferase involved in cell wall biosynthesis
MVVDLSTAQARQGDSTAVAATPGSFEPLLRSAGVELFAMPRRPRLPSKNYADFVQKIVAKFQPDILHVHNMTGALHGRWARRQAPGLLPMVATVHNEFQRTAVLMAFADAVVAVSEAGKQNLLRRHIPRKKLQAVANGIILSPRMQDSFRDDELPVLESPAVLYVGGLHPRKGVHVLIRAFDRVCERVPEASLYIVGNRDAPEIEELAAAQPSGRDRIFFVGFDAQPRRFMRSADVLVAPSLREPYCLVVAEAREAGLPIIASEVDGLPQNLDYGSAGILVPPGDISALADAMVRLIQSEDERKRWSVAASSNLEARTTDRMAQEYRAIYRALLTGP